jgi:AcrR family transcriptional regulator
MLSLTPEPKPSTEEARQRLLHAAVRCFAELGYNNTPTRKIAALAGANIGAISYYFGDKAGLYRAAYTEPMGSAKDDIALFDDPALSLHQALRGVYSGFVAPLKQGELVRQCIRLHMREMVEPTGLWAEEIANGIAPYHAALDKLLCRHYQIAEADDDVTRLSIALVALGVHMYVGRDCSLQLHPHLVQSPAALDTMTERLVMYGAAMVTAEGVRRAAAVN